MQDIYIRPMVTVTSKIYNVKNKHDNMKTISLEGAQNKERAKYGTIYLFWVYATKMVMPYDISN